MADPTRRYPFGGDDAFYRGGRPSDPLRNKIAAPVTVYSNADGSEVETDLQTLAGVAISDGNLSIDYTSRVPQFLGPPGVTDLWVSVDGGPITRIQPVADFRLDLVEDAVDDLQDDVTALGDRVDTLEGAAGGVTSVNGESGAVVLSAADVGADPAGTAAAAVAGLVASAPAALNTLDELAAALNDDASFAASVTTALAAKATQADVTAAVAALKAQSVGVVVAGADLATARPAGWGRVYWLFNPGVDVGAGGANVVNRVVGDQYFVADA